MGWSENVHGIAGEQNVIAFFLPHAMEMFKEVMRGSKRRGQWLKECSGMICQIH